MPAASCTSSTATASCTGSRRRPEHGRERREARRALAVVRGARHRRVRQLDAVAGRAQQEPAAAHVAASDEVGWEDEARTEAVEQHVAVLGGRDAAEQDRGAVLGEALRERARVATQRLVVARVRRVDVDAAEGAQPLGGEPRGRIDETRVAGDHADDVSGIALREALGVRELAAKVEAAREGERFAERHAVPVEAAREREGRVGVQEVAGADAAHLGGREQEDPPQHRSSAHGPGPSLEDGAGARNAPAHASSGTIPAGIARGAAL